MRQSSYLDGTWLDNIPDGNDRGINTARYAILNHVLRG